MIEKCEKVKIAAELCSVVEADLSVAASWRDGSLVGGGPCAAAAAAAAAAASPAASCAGRRVQNRSDRLGLPSHGPCGQPGG